MICLSLEFIFVVYNTCKILMQGGGDNKASQLQCFSLQSYYELIHTHSL